eukprot:TRINITY_DN8651_c0_g1_i1.p1 TRINITY_DN8651_c0_g1~~TRINITY_DN8651_c0_g1_i1.p1  ORF type:complete len:192 (-),score=21.60 TRINITY_DN8651_c0_g1_i1:24-599(-)
MKSAQLQWMVIDLLGGNRWKLPLIELISSAIPSQSFWNPKEPVWKRGNIVLIVGRYASNDEDVGLQKIKKRCFDLRIQNVPHMVALTHAGYHTSCTPFDAEGIPYCCVENFTRVGMFASHINQGLQGSGSEMDNLEHREKQLLRLVLQLIKIHEGCPSLNRCTSMNQVTAVVIIASLLIFLYIWYSKTMAI